MPVEGFDYKQFASDLAAQAKDLVPQDFDEFQKNYVVKTLENFSLLAGEAIYNDDASAFNAEQAILLTQIIAEWSFHKSVDLVNSGIQPEYWDGIMQKIAFTIFDIGKQTIIQGMPTDQILELLEHHVKQAYDGAIEELAERGIIDEELKIQAENQNNLAKLVEEVEAQKELERQMQETENASDKTENKASENIDAYANSNKTKVFKLISLAMVLKTLSKDKVSSILNKVNPQDAQMVIQYMQMPDLNNRVDASTAMQYLKEIKINLPDKNSMSSNNLAYRVKNALKDCTREKIEIMLKRERLKVKIFVTSVLDDEKYELPPKIANIIAQHIESSV
ncbi:hypothetical protein IJG72_04640 [bacterium]|nr:hypothetical protein [bacterium]